MKFDCGPSRQTYEEKIKWHSWFAWYPVRIGPHDCRWLEVVSRKGSYCLEAGHDWWEWEYKSTKEV